MLAYATQIAVVRVVAPARRRAVWMGLRLVGALALAAVWMVGTWVLRAPAALAAKLGAIAWWANLTPGGLIVAPLAAVVRGQTRGRAWRRSACSGLAAAAALLLAVAVARRAGMRGWEEAGAPWAEAAPVPSGQTRPITAATKDLRLITRDGGQMLVLIAMPAIFVGIQIFGSAGWTWSTASLARISCLAYSLALYMATIGPLTHMQAERRAFWILRTVPVPLGKLFAAKARAWSVVVGGAAAFAFLPLALVMPSAGAGRLGSVVVAGFLVVGGAVSMTFLAIAMAAGGADLSDEQTTAVGPATIYAFLLVGGLYNLVLTGDPRTRLSGLGLYLFVTGAYWGAGVARAEICLDAEAVRTPRLRAADARDAVADLRAVARGLGIAAASAHVAVAGMRLGWAVLWAWWRWRCCAARRRCRSGAAWPLSTVAAAPFWVRRLVRSSGAGAGLALFGSRDPELDRRRSVCAGGGDHFSWRPSAVAGIGSREPESVSTSASVRSPGRRALPPAS